MVPRASALVIALLLHIAPAAAGFDRLDVPGGTSAIRRVTGLPDGVSDSMLLVEAARAWYGARGSISKPADPQARLIEHVNTSSEPMAPGPALPLTREIWARLLGVKEPALARAVVSSRNAMLLYHGLMGMDDSTLAWIAGERGLLGDLLENPESFAFAAPAVRVRDGAVVVPGGSGARLAWESLLDAHAAEPAAFIRALMGRAHGRLAWLYSVLAELDEPRLRFALGDGSDLRALARAASTASPEWDVAERPFWRAPFDLAAVLGTIDLASDGAPRGSEEFWREVFRTNDLEDWGGKPGRPLTSGALVSLLFADPYFARYRYDVFSLGQRLLGTERNEAEAGLALRGARRHPAISAMVDRLGIRESALHLALHRSAARIALRDQVGSHGELGAWQGALAMIERAALTGGLDRASTERFLRELAALPADDVIPAIARWLMTSFVSSLSGRPGASSQTEALVLQTMSGVLTPTGSRRRSPFTWEDLQYVYAGPDAIWRRMEDARAAQGGATLDDARLAWEVGEGGAQRAEVERLVARLRALDAPPALARSARRIGEALASSNAAGIRREAADAAAEIVGAVLPVIAYVPHLAVTETPALGADVAARHMFAPAGAGEPTRRTVPWRIAKADATSGWHLEGSLLLLDVALATWYLRPGLEPPSQVPMLDELDVASLGQVAAIARATGPAAMLLEDALQAVARGRQLAAAATPEALDSSLRAAGMTPWRIRELSLDAAGADTAARLRIAEAWRLGGAPGRLISRLSLDGCACFGEPPVSTVVVEGRRSGGMVGAASVDVQLRVAGFLRDRGLPLDLFGDVLAGALAEVFATARAARPDDLQAVAAAAAGLEDERLEEHVLALVADGTLARPSGSALKGSDPIFTFCVSPNATPVTYAKRKNGV